MIILLLLLFPSILVAQDAVISTFTVKMTPPTTAQVLITNYVAPTITSKGKLVAINLLLNDSVYYKTLTGVDIDVKTGQDLTNLKTNIEKEIINKEQGRNYSAGITYPIYRKSK